MSHGPRLLMAPTWSRDDRAEQSSAFFLPIDANQSQAPYKPTACVPWGCWSGGVRSISPSSPHCSPQHLCIFTSVSGLSSWTIAPPCSPNNAGRESSSAACGLVVLTPHRWGRPWQTSGFRLYWISSKHRAPPALTQQPVGVGKRGATKP